MGRQVTFPRWFAALMAALALSSCGGTNYFAPASNKDSDDAIMEDVQKLVDKKQWDAALERMGDLSSSGRDSFVAVRTEAGIHAGKCGLDFLKYASGLDGAGSVFSLFTSGFTTSTVDVAECQAAQTLIETKLGATAVDRASNLPNQQAQNVNFFMAVLGTAKIGTQLRAIADTDQDGTIDAGFDACRAANKMTPAEIIQVGTGFSLLLTNFSAIAAAFGDGNQDALTDVSTKCAAQTPNPCAITDPANSTWTDPPPFPLVEPVAITLFRSLTQSTEFGVGTCTPGSGSYPFDCCVP